MPDDYAAAYRACADTFLKAAYSDAPITQAEAGWSENPP